LAARIENLAARARIGLEDSGRQPGPGPGERRSRADASLTQREREVLAEMATGLSNREIGRRLYISERTAGVHVSRILAKLHARSRVEATAIYLRGEPDGTRSGRT
jgi:DNA-binding NarL/FixJ family response regulator